VEVRDAERQRLEAHRAEAGLLHEGANAFGFGKLATDAGRYA
jgi:hypothetical protein